MLNSESVMGLAYVNNNSNPSMPEIAPQYSYSLHGLV